ncbi:4169_t:CDS:10, partial [Cetraspora pellucida]
MTETENLLYILSKNADDDENLIREQEQALIKLGELYRDQRKPHELSNLIRSSRSFMASIARAKTAKIVKTLIDLFSEIPDTLPLQIEICKETIDWSIQEKRIFLKQSLETRLVALYLDNKMYHDALTLINSLLKELRRLDDKMVLVEVQLLESRVCHALRNLPKSRAALTSARTSANAIYCPPLLQATLDMQSGILHAEDKDYKTAYSYFYETLEGYSSQDDHRAILALKYMLLCKIMLNLSEDVYAIINGKLALRYAGREVDAMKAVATAHQNRSLIEFETALKTYSDELENDPIIRSHLAALYDTLLEQNLVRIIEPFSRVEISHVAEMVKLPTGHVETKLSQMILDKVFHGILDQGAGCLIVFDEPPQDKTYEGALETLKQMGNVVESLYEKKNFMVQTGDPTATGQGGESIYGILHGPARKYFPAEIHPKLKHKKIGTVSMAVAENGNVSGSQFFITTAENLDYLDGKYTIFGEVAEGFDTLEKINSSYCDDTGRPYKDIRIKHTIILDDPFPDPEGLVVPDQSPPPTKEMLATIRIGEDENIEPELPPETMEKLQRQMEAQAQALTLEMIGDIPFAEVKPPENVLFVCKLNPVTRDEDLELIFSRFGTISSCEIIRDKKTGDSLCYAFIEFDNKEDCETAYFKMNNVLIDDRRIKVDFSQSVSKLHKDWIASKVKKERGGVDGGYGGSASLEKRTRYRGGDDAPTDNRLHNSKYRSIYSKDKQKQVESDASVLPESVLHWLTNELGYRHGRSASLLDEVTEQELTKEDTQKLCRNEFVPILNFLMQNGSRSNPEIIGKNRIKKSHQTKRNKGTLTPSESTSIEENYEQRKLKLEKKFSQTSEVVQETEQEIAQLISRIADVESEIRSVKDDISEKKNKIYMKQVFCDSCRRFMNSEAEYRKHLEKFKPKAGTKDEINFVPKGDSSMTTPPKVFLKSMLNTMRSASKDLNTKFEQLAGEKIITDEDSSRTFMRDHSSKFFEVEKILNDIVKINEKILEKHASVKLLVEQKYSHIPSMSNRIISVINARADYEAAQAALSMISSFAEGLERRCQGLASSSDELAAISDSVSNSNQIIEQKQEDIQNLISINQRTGEGLLEQSREISRFIQEELSPFKLRIESLTKDLDCSMLRENEQFQDLNLKLAVQVQLNNDFRTISSLDIYRVFNDKFIGEVKEMIRCPKYSSIDCVLRILADLKREGAALEITRNSLINNMSGVIEESMFNKNVTYEQTIKDMKSSIESLSDMLEKQEKEFSEKYVPKIKEEIEKSNAAENTCKEIQAIIEER